MLAVYLSHSSLSFTNNVRNLNQKIPECREKEDIKHVGHVALKWLPFLYGLQFFQLIYSVPFEEHLKSFVLASNLRKPLAEWSWKGTKAAQVTIICAKAFQHVLSLEEAVV